MKPPATSSLASWAEPCPAPWAGSAVAKKVFVGGHPSWPRPDADIAQDIAGIEAQLAQIERRYPGQIKFTGGERARH